MSAPPPCGEPYDTFRAQREIIGLIHEKPMGRVRKEEIGHAEALRGERAPRCGDPSERRPAGSKSVDAPDDGAILTSVAS
jgi:hypothetical protein